MSALPNVIDVKGTALAALLERCVHPWTGRGEVLLIDGTDYTDAQVRSIVWAWWDTFRLGGTLDPHPTVTKWLEDDYIGYTVVTLDREVHP